MHDMWVKVWFILLHSKGGVPNFLYVPWKALKFLGPDSDVPWQRVISSAGKISSRGPQTEGADRQRMALEDEGVTVQDDMRISWTEYGWFPEEVDLNLWLFYHHWSYFFLPIEKYVLGFYLFQINQKILPRKTHHPQENETSACHLTGIHGYSFCIMKETRRFLQVRLSFKPYSSTLAMLITSPEFITWYCQGLLAFLLR